MTTPSGRPGALLGYGLGQGTRMAWYLGNYLATRAWFSRIDPAEKRRPTLRGRLMGARIQAALTRGALALMARDAAHVRAGLYPMPGDLRPRPGAVGEMVGYWRDLPKVALRRRMKDGQETYAEARDQADPQDGYPRYYLQNFHYQSGGWLTEESADLYDTQVEVLFGGLAQAMRRQGVVPVVDWLRARGSPDGAGFGAGHTLLDLATGTGAMLEAVAQAAPGLALHGLDLSQAYLDKAQRRLAGRDVTWHRAKAEAIPLPDASVDLVTSTYLFHELPKKIRAEVLAEVLRVLKPGGRLVLVDSLQLGDTPALDPVLRGFPDQFHEPYYADWIGSDVPGLLAEAGFSVDGVEKAYLSKVFVAGKR
ncbi:class I SAM-dependent methyltransferase [Thalassobaculum sp. OXR-137]|uniref:class I SAM-dependent methyltransferase n=1 Tax=Thalassobaculum sp. OXR-137 TaxID=3100173 RepID=UPI002AC8CFD0|nr:class I SAM-dependent methyltransferase [Thalassobaculum sp. OXR-137]WPZ35424.1 class I SAM-dependent methyltransferase [Thalassobaculum sp. OXR-137]